MKIVIKSPPGFPCATETFTINGIDADILAFGNSYDDSLGIECDNEDILKYGCVNRVWRRKVFTLCEIEGIKEKYHISTEDIDTICNELETKLSIGECGWCV